MSDKGLGDVLLDETQLEVGHLTVVSADRSHRQNLPFCRPNWASRCWIEGRPADPVDLIW